MERIFRTDVIIEDLAELEDPAFVRANRARIEAAHKQNYTPHVIEGDIADRFRQYKDTETPRQKAEKEFRAANPDLFG